MTNIFIEVLYCHVIYQYHVYFQQYFYTVMWSINIMSILNNIFILSCDLSSTCLFSTIFLYYHVIYQYHVYYDSNIHTCTTCIYLYTEFWLVSFMYHTQMLYILKATIPIPLLIGIFSEACIINQFNFLKSCRDKYCYDSWTSSLIINEKKINFPWIVWMIVNSFKVITEHPPLLFFPYTFIFTGF